MYALHRHVGSKKNYISIKNISPCRNAWLQTANVCRFFADKFPSKAAPKIFTKILSSKTSQGILLVSLKVTNRKAIKACLFHAHTRNFVRKVQLDVTFMLLTFAHLCLTKFSIFQDTHGVFHNLWFQRSLCRSRIRRFLQLPVSQLKVQPQIAKFKMNIFWRP